MAKLAFPSSSSDMDKFRARVQQAPSRIGTIDHTWLMSNIGFTQRSNAGSLLAFLKDTGLVENGGLTDRGKLLLGPSDTAEYRDGMKRATDQLLGAELADTIRSGTIAPASLAAHLQRAFGVGPSVVKKFFPGLRWLATEAGDDQILDAMPPAGRNTRTAPLGERAAPTSGQPNQEKKSGRNTGQAGSRRQQPQTSNQGKSRQSAPNIPSSRLLNGDLVKFTFDSGWKLDDIRAALRMLQQIERGEAIPESEGTNVEPEGAV